MKTEPGTFSWDDLEKDFMTRGWSEWDGVRNYEARNNMCAMKQGDEVFIYHSSIKPAIVGIGRIVHEAHADSSDTSGLWQCVDVAPVKKFACPISLAVVKALPQLKSMTLVKRGRLSVQSVTHEEWKFILKLAAVTS